MRASSLPFFEVDLGAVVSLLFLRVAFPGLVGLAVRTLISLVSRIVFRGLFAHGLLQGWYLLEATTGGTVPLPERCLASAVVTPFAALECPMSKATGRRPLAFSDGAQTTYLVVDDLGELGQVWREADPKATELENVLQMPARRPVQQSGARCACHI